jgi:hypothetical protein
VREPTQRIPVKEIRIVTGLFALSTVKRHRDMAALRGSSGDFVEPSHGKYRLAPAQS